MAERPTYEEMAQQVLELREAESLRRKAEEALERSERQKDLILNTTSEMIACYDTDLRILRVNRAAAESVDKSPEEMIGLHCYTLWNQSDEPCADCPVIKARDEKRPRQIERQTPDGRTWRIRGYPILDDQQNVIALAEFTQEITELRRSRERLGLALETARLGYWRWSAATGEVEWFGDHAALFGIKNSEFRGSLDHVQEMVHPDDRDMGVFNLPRAVEENLPFDNTYRVIHPDGSVHWLNSFGHVSLDDQGKASHIFGITRDISKFKSAEENLRLSEARYRMFFEEGPDGVVIIDPRTGTIIEFNDQACRQLGYGRDEFSRLSISDVEDVESREALLDHIQKVLRDGRDDFETRQRAKNGEIRYVHVTAQAIQVEKETVYHCIWRDITDKKRVEDDLRKSREQYVLAVRGSQDGIWDWDLKDNSLYLSPRWKEMIGYRDEELPNAFSTFEGHLHPEDSPAVMAHVDRYLKGRIPNYSMEFRLRHKDGTYRWILARGEALRDENGVAYRMAGSHADITEQKTAEQKLLESERNYRDLFNNSNDAIFVHDADTGEIVDVNRTACELFGYSVDELRSLSLADVSSNEPPYTQREALRWIHRAKNEGPQRFRWRAKNNKGVLMWFENSLVYATIGARDRVLVFGRNIDDRVKAEEERERLLSAMEQVGEVIVITDPYGGIQYVNPAFEKVTGYGTKEVKGQNPRILKSGKQDERFYEKMWQKIKNGETWQGRLINKRKDGSLYTEEATISPVMDPGGGIMNFVAVKRDVTSEVELENRLAQAQKMEAIGTLAGGIAHDFNNILSAIMGFTELVEIDLPEGSRNKEDLGEAIQACRRARDLVKQILTFSRQTEHEVKPLRIDLIVKEALKMIRASTPTSIEIRQDVSMDLPTVIADPTQVHQIVMNLCANAVHAIQDEHGIIALSLDTIRVDDPGDERSKKPLPGEYVRLVVSDTGKGISPEIQERIFEPYFTTKKKGEGTGLGLSVVYGIVREYGGTISVESEPGGGTTFTVHFPVAEKSEFTQFAGEKFPLPRGKERILFVDDETPIANLAKKQLERFGYHVTIRQSALEALELFRRDPLRFDVVVTDMTMPQMTGDELAVEILKIQPDIPVILCTGYSRRMSDRRAGELGISAFLMKPLTGQELAKTVRRVLDEEGAVTQHRPGD